MTVPPPPLAPVEVLERAARGAVVDAASVGGLVRAWVDGIASDAQMAAWCALASARGLDVAAVDEVTRALIASGRRLDLTRLGPVGAPLSTGAVGDSSSLLAPPIAAALGVRVATMAEPSLGPAGGALDKLGAIPGFRADLPLDRFVRQVRDVGIAVAGAGGRLAPADSRLTALRDQTGSARSDALVAASLMSRAIATGATAIAVNLGVGEGALLGRAEDAVRSASAMHQLGESWGRGVRWIVTSADRPLGRFVGNALEVREAAAVLTGEGPDDLRELAGRLAGDLAELAGAVPEGEGVGRAARVLRDGSALRLAERWIEAQEGDPDVWTNPAVLARAPVEQAVGAPAAGVLRSISARRVGEAARWLGAGRLHAQQTVDPLTGVELLAGIGDAVQVGDAIALVHARDAGLVGRAVEMVAGAVAIGDEGEPPAPLILDAGGSGA